METENTKEGRTARRKKERPQQINETQPKPFIRRKLLVQLLTVAAVVLAVVIGISVFFQVDEVLVSGTSKYSTLTIAEASGVKKGDSLLFFGRGKAARRIISRCPYVGSVRFELKLPGTVHIVIGEKTVAYAFEDTKGEFWNVTSDGFVVEQVEPEEARAIVKGVTLKNPRVGKKAKAAEVENSAETATQAERLKAAINLIEKIEYWEFFEDVTQIDVSDLYGLRLYCSGNYRVELGSMDDIKEKIGNVRYALNEWRQQNTDGGVLKVMQKDGEWEVQCNPWT